MMMTNLLVVFWLVCNVVVARTMTVEEMREEFVTNQTLIGRIGANSFYCLAWLLQNF
jgi:hypothetical protein